MDIQNDISSYSELVEKMLKRLQKSPEHLEDFLNVCERQFVSVHKNYYSLLTDEIIKKISPLKNDLIITAYGSVKLSNPHLAPVETDDEEERGRKLAELKRLKDAWLKDIVDWKGLKGLEFLLKQVNKRWDEYVNRQHAELKKLHASEPAAQATTTRRQSKKPETLIDILLNPDDEQFVNDALREVGVVDAAGNYALLKGSKIKLLGFIHLLREEKILKDLPDTTLQKIFSNHIGIEYRRLKKEGSMKKYEDAKNDTEEVLIEYRQTRTQTDKK